MTQEQLLSRFFSFAFLHHHQLEQLGHQCLNRLFSGASSHTIIINFLRLLRLSSIII